MWEGRVAVDCILWNPVAQSAQVQQKKEPATGRAFRIVATRNKTHSPFRLHNPALCPGDGAYSYAYASCLLKSIQTTGAMPMTMAALRMTAGT